MSSDSAERRLAPVFLFLSAMGFVAIVGDEGFSGKAVPPVPGDVPTYGFGSTTGPDGKPIKGGETITVPAAIKLIARDVQVKEAAIKRCVTAPLAQYEYDVYVSLSYNIGEGTFCNSTLVKKLNALDYVGACEQIKEFVCGPATEETRAKPGERCYSKKKPLRVLRGLEARRNRDFTRCMGGDQ